MTPMESHNVAGPALPVAGSRPPRTDGGRLPWVALLWLKPSRFFELLKGERPGPLIVAAACLAGVAQTLERTDRNMGKAAARGAVDGMAWVTQSWTNYWLLSLAVGLLLGSWMYYLWGGWWFRVRLRWAGVVDPDVVGSRDVYVLAHLVQDVPLLLYAVVSTATWSTPIAALEHRHLGLAGGLLGFAVWSSWVGYRGAVTYFGAPRRGASVWFFALPAAFYAVLMALLVGAMVLLEGVAAR